MKNIDLLRECGALAGYTVDAASGQDPANKIRAQRRLTVIKADVISRFAGKWPSNYREAWLALAPLYNTGTITLTNGSRTVTGSGTVWTSSMVGSKLMGADVAYYKIASVSSGTVLTLTEPYQGVTISAQTYQIWQDEYVLYPEVLSLGGFVDYYSPRRMEETWESPMKDSYPYPTDVANPSIYTVLGRKRISSTYSTGTVSGTINTNVLTGVGTVWTSYLQPGYEIIIGTTSYHVLTVDSDTQITLNQLLTATYTGQTYTAMGKNAVVVRFQKPTNQRIVHYWYYAKDYPLVSDNDEDWIAEQFPRVLINGMSYFDYLDKNDVPRGMNSQQVFENSIKDMKVSIENAYTGIRTLGIYVPPSARD